MYWLYSQSKRAGQGRHSDGRGRIENHKPGSQPGRSEGRRVLHPSKPVLGDEDKHWQLYTSMRTCLPRQLFLILQKYEKTDQTSVRIDSHSQIMTDFNQQ